MRNRTVRSHGCSGISLLIILSLLNGCSTAKGTGALAGAGVGTLIGAAVGDTQSAIIGAAIGTGVGYIIGDQVDEQRAKDIQAGKGTVEVAPLAGTKWKLTSVDSKRPIPAYVSKVVEFRPDAHVITTTTRADGKIDTFDELYRVVGDTLVISKPGYMVNAKYKLKSDQLLLTDPQFSATLTRLPA